MLMERITEGEVLKVLDKAADLGLDACRALRDQRASWTFVVRDCGISNIQSAAAARAHGLAGSFAARAAALGRIPSVRERAKMAKEYVAALRSFRAAALD